MSLTKRRTIKCNLLTAINLGFLLRKESEHPRENELGDVQKRGAQPETQGPTDVGQQGVEVELDRSRDGHFHCVFKGDIETWLL